MQHDLARDPPFSKVDLVSCRNVLIYFDQELQKRVIPTFHYALNQPGFLLLGRAENIAGFTQLFQPFDKANKDLRADLGAEHAPVRATVRGAPARGRARRAGTPA